MDGYKKELRVDQIIAVAAGVLILVFTALHMTIPSAGGGTIFFLLIVSLIGLLRNRKKIPLNRAEHHLILVVLFFFFVYVINILMFDVRLRELDNASRFILLLPIFFYLRKVNIRAEYFLFSIILGAIACGLFSFYQIFYLEIDRAHGITGAISFGRISTVLGLMCLPGVFLKTLSKPLRFLMLTGFLMGMTGSILSETRGGWIAIPAGFLIVVLMNPMKWGWLKRTVSITIFLFSIAGLYYFPDIQVRVDTAINEFKAYFSSGVVGPSVGLRLEAWRGSILAISDSPIFGVGSNNFGSTMQALTDKGLVNASVLMLNYAHSEYISATLSRGLIGLLSLVLIFIVPLRAFMKITDKGGGLNQLLAMSGVILITSYMIFSLTDTVFGAHNTTLLYVAYIFIIYGMTSPKNPGQI
ncbi:O-antigen ligase family protein [Thermodesulfovibrionales bacterium]|nr:O-antigen ligase family protein [Thermodesulfovibrionales bacterium]